MTAQLDSRPNYGDYTGGVSDPRLINQVDRIPPVGPHIPDPAAQRSVLASIAEAVDNANQAAELWDMLYAPIDGPGSTDPSNPFRTGVVPSDATADASTPERDCE